MTAQCPTCGQAIVDTPRAVSMDDVAEATARYYNITIEDLKGRSRRSTISEPRKVFYLVSRKAGFTLDAIGGWADRDHATVLDGAQRMELAYQAYPDVARSVENVWSQARMAVGQ